MNLPFFYKEFLDIGSGEILLDEVTSKHIVQVLRMQAGENVQLTDGKGNVFTAAIRTGDRKKCVVEVLTTGHMPPSNNRTCIAISLVKNSSRFEWFLEKATEIGISSIVPLICERTEKQHFRFDRMKNILISAMLQSQQCWLPELYEPVAFDGLWQSAGSLLNLDLYPQKFIAHCGEGEKIMLTDLLKKEHSSRMILIGPEGDFTDGEIEISRAQDFIPVALGETRLRTETAGTVAAGLLCLV